MGSNEVDAEGVRKFLCLSSQYMTCKKTGDQQLSAPTCGVTGSDCCPAGRTHHFSDGTVRACNSAWWLLRHVVYTI